MSFPIQLVVLIALVVSGSVALAQEQGQHGPTKQPIGNGMSNEQMQMMHHQMVPGSQTWDTTTPTMPGQDAFGPNGVLLTVTSGDPQQVQHIRGLGFIGFMASGSHHQAHHLAMAKGQFLHHSQ